MNRLKTVFSDQVWHSRAESGFSVLVTNLAVSDAARDTRDLTVFWVHDEVSLSFMVSASFT